MRGHKKYNIVIKKGILFGFLFFEKMIDKT